MHEILSFFQFQNYVEFLFRKNCKSTTRLHEPRTTVNIFQNQKGLSQNRGPNEKILVLRTTPNGSIFLGKNSKIEQTYVIKIPVCDSKSIPTKFYSQIEVLLYLLVLVFYTSLKANIGNYLRTITKTMWTNDSWMNHCENLNRSTHSMTIGCQLWVCS